MEINISSVNKTRYIPRYGTQEAPDNRTKDFNLLDSPNMCRQMCYPYQVSRRQIGLQQQCRNP